MGYNAEYMGISSSHHGFTERKQKAQVRRRRRFLRRAQRAFHPRARRGWLLRCRGRQTPARHEIIIRATRTQNVLGEKGRRIRELTAVVQKRFGFLPGSVELYAEKVQFRGLCAVAQAEALKFKLLGGLAVRRACYGVIRNVMES